MTAPRPHHGTKTLTPVIGLRVTALPHSMAQPDPANLGEALAVARQLQKLQGLPQWESYTGTRGLDPESPTLTWRPKFLAGLC